VLVHAPSCRVSRRVPAYDEIALQRPQTPRCPSSPERRRIVRQWSPLPPDLSQRSSASRWSALWQELRWPAGEHLSILRECFSFSTRLCAMSHISDASEAEFFPLKLVEQLSPAPSLRPPRFIRSPRGRRAGSCAVPRCPLTSTANRQQHISSVGLVNGPGLW
jgi:hypothetical protein